jgi:hypothetical protein
LAARDYLGVGVTGHANDGLDALSEQE